MTNGQTHKDLVVLVSDKNMEHAVKGLLSRHQSLGIRQLSSDVFPHPYNDPGCLRAHEFLRPFVRRYEHALVMFDRDGCGRAGVPREILEAEIEDHLSQNGWNNRACAVTIDPELEVWVWSDSPLVDTVLGWGGKQPKLRTWLRREGLLLPDQIKPNRPKEAVEQALRLASRARSSSRYLELAQRVSLDRCVDPAFVKFKTVLKTWFAGGEILSL